MSCRAVNASAAPSPARFPSIRRCLLADEPTGNLDTHTGADILKLIRDLHQRLGATILIVTHDAHVAESCARVVALCDGRIEEDRAGKFGAPLHDSAQAH